jgi:tRNA modification GTPase
MDLGGLPVTLLDTAGLRETADVVESMGIARARARAEAADLRVFLVEVGEMPEMTPREGDIVLRAKADLLVDVSDAVSGRTGAGVSELVERIRAVLAGRVAGAGIATRARHRQAIERGLVSLRAALGILPQGEAVAEIAAEELRAAIRALDSLVGRIDVEMVLEEIFASFCLGK